MNPLPALLVRLRGRHTGEGFDRRLIAPMIVGSILNPINSSMLAVALIPIGAALGAPPSETVWLVSGLYLASAVGQPVVGRLVDMFGPRTLYLSGTALAGVAGILGALAPNLGFLILARVVLGFATCAAYPASMYLIRGESERTGTDSPSAVLAALSAANQTVAVIGPTLGGLLIGLGGWRTIFTVNIPLSLACLVLGALRLPKTRRDTKAGWAGLDVPGMVLFAGMLTALLLFLMDLRADRWWLPALALAAGAAFARRELRHERPFLDLRVLGGNPALLATFLRQTLAFTVTYAFMYGFTQWLEEGRGLHASAAGLVLLPLSGSAILVTVWTGRRKEVRGKLIVGGVAQIAGSAGILFIGDGSPIWTLLALCVVLGIPQGLNGLANQNALYHQAEPARMGSSAGLLRTFMYLGALIASSANAAFFTDGAHTSGLHGLAVFMGVVAVLLLAVTLLDRSLRRVCREPVSDKGKEATVMPLSAVDDQAALVLVDFQKGTAAAPGAPIPMADAVANGVRLAEAFRAAGHPVVLVRVETDLFPPGRTDVGPRSGSTPAEFAQLLDGLAGHESDIVVTKRNWGAFHGTDLDVQLRRRGVTQVVLGGVATSIGVESTARAAHEHGYHVALATDAMTDVDAGAHENSVAKIFPKLGETTTTDEVISALKG
ncbi:MFS transporter [Phytomonospora endophytica]|uniref:Nicotinamidase-related amidase/predicted MFS family arabinose efflux permease n=1 Tax=Phytomonospora endophytica TaxID=714109 RepID=A0A841G1E9_9ACTN|nr:MFS transporter [Phytomonospora endophytica]MBB6037990.1 nicotinamidase-related amidase/predicted MFS family arabinose efflux permease [Phytomonospora endophytica]GIG68889.1 hypothetical protein Pen01_51840 [Phytomonospora endophytica]